MVPWQDRACHGLREVKNVGVTHAEKSRRRIGHAEAYWSLEGRKGSNAGNIGEAHCRVETGRSIGASAMSNAVDRVGSHCWDRRKEVFWGGFCVVCVGMEAKRRREWMGQWIGTAR